jgi:sulfonate transport system permease protein
VSASTELNEPPALVKADADPTPAAPDAEVAPKKSTVRLHTILAFPMAAALALIVHYLASKKELPVETHSYTVLLLIILVSSVLMAAVQPFWLGLRRWLGSMAPILAAALVFLCAWEVITAGFRLLPMPYFPSPAGVLQSMIDDRAMIWESTLHSLGLLLGGYTAGVIAGLITGICIGWFEPARYWGMPVMKIVGPIPATALIPLAMVVLRSPYSAAALISLAVWFPVSMLTLSGISNTKASYIDVARTLGAGRAYLIFRVAIPAAMPNIFIGLFMGLGASFLTLVVAESVGVRSGLGYYLTWAQQFAEYGKVYAALVVMSVFFSTIMTLLFKVRDRVLVWQKGMIKW